MKKLLIKGFLYYASESEAEDRLFGNIWESMDPPVEMNYTTGALIFPTISNCRFFLTLGREVGPIDTWPKNDIRLYRKLRSMPQHFKLVPHVCLTKESYCQTDLWAVYIKEGAQKCGCEYCTKGLQALISEREA